MKLSPKYAVLMAALMGLSVASAQTPIYQNTTSDLNIRFNPGTLEIGDELEFAGTHRQLAGFSFEYWGTSSAPNNFAGSVEARVRFYENDGPLFNTYASPGTVIYDSQWFAIGATERNTLNFYPGFDRVPFDLILPDSMTFSVQFQGMALGDAVGVDLYDPPAVGSSMQDYWKFESGAWTLQQNAAGPVNFALQVSAVPEPTSLALLIAGGIVLLWRRNR